MNDDDKKSFLDEFKKVDGSKRLDMWDYALSQQVLWEKLITKLSEIAKQQGVDKQLEKMFEEDLKKSDSK